VLWCGWLTSEPKEKQMGLNVKELKEFIDEGLRNGTLEEDRLFYIDGVEVLSIYSSNGELMLHSEPEEE
jgi:hypothetical protein